MRSEPAWVQVYRALNHGPAKASCKNQDVIRRFPDDVQDFADRFYSMQIKRHRADYDPTERFVRSDVVQDIDAADDAIRRFEAVPIKHRRAFAAWVVFAPPRKD